MERTADPTLTCYVLHKQLSSLLLPQPPGTGTAGDIFSRVVTWDSDQYMHGLIHYNTNKPKVTHFSYHSDMYSELVQLVHQVNALCSKRSGYSGSVFMISVNIVCAVVKKGCVH